MNISPVFKGLKLGFLNRSHFSTHHETSLKKSINSPHESANFHPIIEEKFCTAFCLSDKNKWSLDLFLYYKNRMATTLKSPKWLQGLCCIVNMDDTLEGNEAKPGFYSCNQTCRSQSEDENMNFSASVKMDALWLCHICKHCRGFSHSKKYHLSLYWTGLFWRSWVMFQTHQLYKKGGKKYFLDYLR